MWHITISVFHQNFVYKGGCKDTQPEIIIIIGGFISRSGEFLGSKVTVNSWKDNRLSHTTIIISLWQS